MLRVTSVEPLAGHRLRVGFSDGVEREIDCTFLLHGTLGEPLRDPEYFARVRVDDEARTVVWPNGLYPSPDLLRAGAPLEDGVERRRFVAKERLLAAFAGVPAIDPQQFRKDVDIG